MRHPVKAWFSLGEYISLTLESCIIYGRSAKCFSIENITSFRKPNKVNSKEIWLRFEENRNMEKNLKNYEDA